jgi:Family of unknown function (DUF5691)
MPRLRSGVGRRMSAQQFKNEVVPALLRGISRQPIDFSRLLDGAISPDDPKSGLKALALACQALRFERPAPPSDYEALLARGQSRANPPEELRPKLIRLLGDGKSAVAPQDDLALAMALAFERRRLQPHPFDFPRMDGFLRAHAERLGPEARAWLHRDQLSDDGRGYLDIEAIDDGNWREARPACRQRYIEQRRRQDAAAARALVEAAWSSEDADIRFGFLQALRHGLSPADIPFLRGLAKDRAPRVRQLAEQYLSRLPDAAEQSAALTLILDRIVRGRVGILRKRPTLKLELSAAEVGQDWRFWASQAARDVELDELAHALGLQPAEMIAAAAEDPCLSAAITIMAFRQDCTDLAYQAYETTPENSRWLDWQLLQAIDPVAPEARRDLAEYLIRETLGAGFLTDHELTRAHQSLQGPLSEALIEEIIEAPIWAQWAAAPERWYLSSLAAVAALCPQVKRPRFREALAQIDSASLASVHQFLDILDILERVSPHE